MENTDMEEKIRAFVANELSDSEAAALLETCKANPIYAEDLRLGLAIRKAVENREALSFQAEMQAIMQQEGIPKVDTPTGFGKWIRFRNALWITGLLLFTGTSIFFWQQKRTADIREHSKSVSALFMEPLENVLYTNETVGMDLQTAMDEYDTGNYRQAIKKLRPYYQRTNDYNAGLFLGVSYVMNHETELAIQTLKEAVPHLKDMAKESAQWYLGIAYLQAGQRNEATEVLKQFSTESLYYESAQDVLSKVFEK